MDGTARLHRKAISPRFVPTQRHYAIAAAHDLPTDDLARLARGFARKNATRMSGADRDAFFASALPGLISRWMRLRRRSALVLARL